MFDSITDLSGRLAATGYFIDPVMTQVVFLAAKLQKPLLLEGPAGSGKTQLALSVAEAEEHRRFLLLHACATNGFCRTVDTGRQFYGIVSGQLDRAVLWLCNPTRERHLKD
jgi:sigma54-dependent transcription regulator